jgi:hypothetical protein
MFVKLTISEATLNRLFTVSDLLDTDVEKLINIMLDDVENGGICNDDGRSNLWACND